MTVLIASIFLPYTIDFKPSKQPGHHQSPNPTSDHPAAANRPQSKPLGLGLTPGATTEDEKIFRPYASRSAGEIPSVDDPNGRVPSEPRLVSWGQSRKFNQPPSKAAELRLQHSILGRPESSISSSDIILPRDVVAPVDAPYPYPEEGHRTPRSLLSGDWVVKAAEQGNGALRNAVNAAGEAGILMDKMWIGTLGMPTDLLDDETRASIAETLENEHESLSVFISDDEFEGHYAHFCRTVLWPAFHYQMQETPRHTEYDDYSWKQYVRVNEAFANKIAAHWRPGDSIWIHDYHLLLLPRLLRERLPNAQIGFFMHAAFPSSELFRCLNLRHALLKGVLGADLVGFQTDEYCQHFVHTCSRLLGVEVSVDGVQLRDRFVPVKEFPFGIDPIGLDRVRLTTEVKGWIDKISSRYQGKRLVIARDRLDGPAGIKQKLLAYEMFLKHYPKWRENVVLIQIVTSPAEIPELEAQISKIAMRVNSTYSTLTHQPLVLLRQDTSYSQFLALMTVADIFMVTCLREGMNLTSHDYVQCQDGALTSVTPQRHGSLILSEFAGSASIFSGHGLLVNPWDYKQCADSINTALEMSPEQKQRNWQYLRDRMAPHTAIAWCSSFSKTLSEAHGVQLSREPYQVSALSINDLKRSYDNSSLRLFFLEDERIGIVDSISSLPSKQWLSLLNKLLEDTQNIVYITSNKSPEKLEPLLLYINKALLNRRGIGLIAENGCFLREINNDDTSSKWETLANIDKTKEWRNGVRKVMEYFQQRTDGSWIEERSCSLTFRYDGALGFDRESAGRQASELADQINSARGSEAIRVTHTEGAVVFEPSDVTKATAAECILGRLLARTPPKSESELFLFVAGSARSDEPLFRWANGSGIRIPNNINANVNTLYAGTGAGTGTHATQAKTVLADDVSLESVIDALCSSATTSASADSK